MSGLDVLAFGAHPDDVEIGMGGTLAKLAEAGWKTGICDLTRAELSSNGNVEIRQKEAEHAAKALRLAFRSNLALPDRGLRLVQDQLDMISREIRLRKPRIVCAPYPKDRHPDHEHCGKMIKEAVFNAKLRRYMPELPPWKVEKVYYYFINDVAEPGLIVDISEVYQHKRDVLSCYQSQFEAGPDTVETPLNRRYLERVEARDSLLGQAGNIAFAEGFISETPYLAEYL